MHSQSDGQVEGVECGLVYDNEVVSAHERKLPLNHVVTDSLLERELGEVNMILRSSQEVDKLSEGSLEGGLPVSVHSLRQATRLTSWKSSRRST